MKLIKILELQKIFLIVRFFNQISCNKGLKAKISCFFLYFFCLPPEAGMLYNQKDYFIPHITYSVIFTSFGKLVNYPQRGVCGNVNLSSLKMFYKELNLQNLCFESLYKLIEDNTVFLMKNLMKLFWTINVNCLIKMISSQSF